MNTQKTILIVDDEIVNREFFELMLSKLGFVVKEASDGAEGLEKVKAFSPDLILLDNIMPKMTGWELTRILKNDPRYSDIPIIMLSALDDVKDKVEGFELGVDDYITKPFNFTEVLARILAVLRNRDLFTQIVSREARLSLAEELGRDIKINMQQFIKSIDDLDGAALALKDDEKFRGVLEQLREKTQAVRKQIAELDARIEKINNEWDDLKKSEIGLPALEDQIHSGLKK